VLGCAALALVGAYALLEGTARLAERYLGAYLWKEQDYLRLFSPANHVGRGAGRLLIYGPSEAREGLLPEELEKRLPGLKPYQNAQSIGTLEDGLVVLNYLEAAYGPSAIPDALLLGISTRFIASIRLEPSPLLRGIESYSPHFRVDESQHPPGLVPRSTLDSLRARLAILRLQPDRYRRGLFAFASRTAIALEPRLLAYRRLQEPILPAKYQVGKMMDTDRLRKWLVEPGNFWEAVHKWDPDRDRERVTRDLGLLLDFTSSHNIALYVVNLPELSWNRALYAPGRYEAYLKVVRGAIGNTPFLDLRMFLTDEEFFDDAHPTWPGGIRVSEKVAAFIGSARPTRAVRVPEGTQP
jgi:hypothetical protein